MPRSCRALASSHTSTAPSMRPFTPNTITSDAGPNFLASGDFDLVISTPGVTLSQVTVPLPGGIWLAPPVSAC